MPSKKDSTKSSRQGQQKGTDSSFSSAGAAGYVEQTPIQQCVPGVTAEDIQGKMAPWDAPSASAVEEYLRLLSQNQMPPAEVKYRLESLRLQINKLEPGLYSTCLNELLILMYDLYGRHYK